MQKVNGILVLLCVATICMPEDTFYLLRDRAATTTKNPKPCCVPKQWEGSIARVSVYEFRRGDKATTNRQQHSETIGGSDYIIGRMSYDFTRHAVAMSLNIRDVYNRRIYRKNATTLLIGNKAYFVNLRRGTCRKFTFPNAFREFCVPKDAKLAASPVFGLDQMKTNTFVGEQRGWWGKERYVTTVTDGACLPVAEENAGVVRSVHYGLQHVYFDISAGIKDASVFDVPKGCKEAETADEILQEMPGQLRDMSLKFLQF